MVNDQELIQEIIKSIKIASVKGTLTEDAAAYINKILDENKRMNDELSVSKNIIQDQNEKISKYKLDIDSFYSKKNFLAKKERDIEEREIKMTRIECELELQKLRVADHKEMFSVIFRNIETRRDIFTPVSGGQNCSGHVQKNEQLEKSI